MLSESQAELVSQALTGESSPEIIDLLKRAEHDAELRELVVDYSLENADSEAVSQPLSELFDLLLDQQCYNLISAIDYGAALYFELRAFQYARIEYGKHVAAKSTYSLKHGVAIDNILNLRGTHTKWEILLNGYDLAVASDEDKDKLLFVANELCYDTNSRKVLEIDKKYNLVGWLNNIVTNNNTRTMNEVAGLDINYQGLVYASVQSKKYPYSFIDLCYKFPYLAGRCFQELGKLAWSNKKAFHYVSKFVMVDR